MKTLINRRQFLSSLLTAAAGTALLAGGCAPAPEKLQPTALPPEKGQTLPTQESTLEPPAPTPTPPAGAAPATETPLATSAPATEIPAAAGAVYLAAAHGTDPAAITRAAVKAVGGMERFVKPGQSVVVKPNICVDYHTFEYAATTNPVVVATLVKMALEAGAGKVSVFDMPFGGTPEAAYKNSGIAEAVSAAGGEMVVMSPVKYVKTAIPAGRDIQSWKIYKPALDADVLINAPVAKTHGLARLTLSTKNLFGLAMSPNGLHINLGQRAADLLSLVRPALTVIDAVRVLTANGPTGGNLDDVKKLDTVLASADGIAADSYATSFFGMKGEDIAYIKAGAEMGLGKMDLNGLKIEEINV